MINLAIIGLCIISYSAYIKYYLLLCIGRIIVGVGNEGISMAAKLYAIKFFNQNEYGILFGMYLAFISFGGGANTFISYRIYVWLDIVYSMSFPLVVAPFVSIPLFVLMFVEKIYYTPKTNATTESKQLIDTKTRKDPVIDANKFRLSDIKVCYIYIYIE